MELTAASGPAMAGALSANGKEVAPRGLADVAGPMSRGAA